VKAIDFRKLWEILTEQFPLSIHSIHGPRHWKQVERNGLLIAKETGVDETIIKLFALFHDSRRENENIDNGHGLRGAELARSLKGVLFDLPDKRLEIMIDACQYHTEDRRTSDITIATCWDADRLDLPRVGIKPDPDKMGTAYGKRIARTL
jgi:uncharacterized protein